mmetsp:Transcript_18878/g.24528  ORF Transcript_18878/g.24528 Transcript_18878/m.24528 type:complete len:128 (-) Transcript_18878:2629-3012(-)
MNKGSSFLARLHESHSRLKHRVHTAWRVPLPKWGRIVMGAFYFCVPVVGGYNVMMWAIGKSHESIGEKGEKLKIKEVEGIGGGVGFGGGVKLVNSTKDEQERNKALLAKILKRHERKAQLLKEKRND